MLNHNAALIRTASALLDSAAAWRSIGALTTGGLITVGATSVSTLSGSAAGSTPVWLASSSTWVDSIRAWAIGTTTTPGLVLENTTAAANGAQQSSAALCLAGQGWKTNTTAESQRVACYIDVLPVQGAAAPTGTLQFKWGIAAGAIGGTAATLTSAGVLTAYTVTSTAATTAGQYVVVTAGTNLSTGLGTIASYACNVAAVPVGILHSRRTDGASNVVAFVDYDRDASSITNATTMRQLSLAWTTDADARVETASFRCNGDLFLCQAATGNSLAIKHLTELVTIAAAASTATTIAFPAGCIRLGASVRVTTVIPTAATFVVTSTADTTAHTGAVSTAATTTDAGTLNCPLRAAASNTITITPNATPADNTGRVRVDLYYIELTPATS